MKRRETLTAELTAPSAPSEGERLRDVVFYSGAEIERWSWSDGRYWLRFSMAPEDVILTRLNTGAPVMANHGYSLTDQIGVVNRAWLEDGKAKATLRFSGRDDVTPIWEDIEAGIIRNVSMGVSIEDLLDVTPKGSPEKHFLARQWEPYEISAVPVNADPKAQFLSARFAFDDFDLDFAAAHMDAGENSGDDRTPDTMKLLSLKAARLRLE